MIRPVALKALSTDRAVIAGYAVVFGGADLTGEAFGPETDLWLDRLTRTPPVLYEHGRDPRIGKTALGSVISTRADEIGLWIEAEIDRHRKYAAAVLALVQRGVLGLSTGAVAHLVERKGTTIESWPIAEVSLTPVPAEPRTVGVRQVKAVPVTSVHGQVETIERYRTLLDVVSP